MPSNTDQALRVLIVEDEHLLGMFLVDILEDLDCAVIATVDSGAEAIKAAEKGFDLAFVDIGLKGGMDGVETAVRLRGMHRGPIVFTSGASGPELMQRTEAAAPLAFLLKPFGASEVEAIVARAAELRALDTQ
jgi:CheY-like chemotaxis protein